MPVSKRLRFEVLRRDGHKCRYCGRGVSDAIITVDHVTPTALGGTDLPDNLVAACEECNAGKTSTIPDGPTITGAADDAVRWARAIKLAAAELEQQEQPKHDYRAAFKTAWEYWGYDSGGKRVTFELDPEWATTMDRFRLAGLPSTAWPDIVESAMTSRAKLDSRFRYCCGIAWRMITELQERAKEIVGDGQPLAVDGDPKITAVIETACVIWRAGMTENDEPPAPERVEAFRRSFSELSILDLTDCDRIVAAAEHATFFGTNAIAEALRDLDHARAWQAWSAAWPTTYVPGDPANPFSGTCTGGPGKEAINQISKQINQLLDANVHAHRIERAAAYAGFHKSERLYRGLTEHELDATGEIGDGVRTLEVWAASFEAIADRRPDDDECRGLAESLELVVQDGDFQWRDLLFAAAAAGAYQDTDMTTCLPRRGSVFEIAAQPLAAAIAND